MKEAKLSSPKILSINDFSRIKYAKKDDQKVAKRTIRENLLKAWDIHTKNIAYGVEEETEEEHIACLNWYKALKDLEDWAFEQIPNGVQQYLKKF